MLLRLIRSTARFQIDNKLVSPVLRKGSGARQVPTQPAYVSFLRVEKDQVKTEVSRPPRYVEDPLFPGRGCHGAVGG